MVAPGGGGRVWLLPGAMRGCSRGACVVAPGGGGMRGCSGGGGPQAELAHGIWDTMEYDWKVGGTNPTGKLFVFSKRSFVFL